MTRTLKQLIPSWLKVRLYRLILIGKKIIDYILYIKVKNFSKSETKFSFNNTEYEYHIALHNTTFLNERAVEIPIILDYIKEFENKEILEVGNVISYYTKVEYDILDKYERGRGVINQDIVDYQPQKRYDLIISISTFEHIGYDEVSRYGKNKETRVKKRMLLDAIENTKHLLKPNGTFVFTAPLGFNDYLDSQLIGNRLELTETHFLKRISASNKWIQVEQEDMIGIKYNDPYPWANGLLIGIYSKSAYNKPKSSSAARPSA